MEHRDVIDNLDDLAVVHMQTARDDLAAKEFDRERRAIRMHVARILPVLGAQEQLTFMKNGEWYLHHALTFGLLQAANPALTELSAAWILNGKSVVETSLAERTLLARDGDNPELRRQVEELTRLRTELANLCLTAPGAGEPSRAGHLRQLSEAEHELARKVGLATGLTQQNEPWTDTAEVRRMLSDDAVLVEIARFRPKRLNWKRGEPLWSPARYVAWIIPPAGAGNVSIED